MATNPYAAIALKNDNPYAGIALRPNDAPPTEKPPSLMKGNAVQREYDRLTEIKPLDFSSVSSGLDTTLGNMGAGLMGTVSPLVHPEKFAQSLEPRGGLLQKTWETVGGPAAVMIDRAIAPFMPQGGESVKEYSRRAGGQGLGLLGNIAGSAGIGEAAGAASEPLQAGGARLINRTAGSLLKDYAHGADPGRAYLEGGGTPALTMRGLGNKSAAINEATGTKIGGLLRGPSGDTMIPTEEILPRISEPTARLRTQMEGPGGTGAPPSLFDFESRFLKPLATAEDAGGMPARDLFAMKKNVMANTRWNDPAQFDMNAMRQQVGGGLSGLLKEKVPEAGPLFKIYQGTENLANRALGRAATGSMPLTTLGAKGLELALAASGGGPRALPFLLDTVPVRTTAGYGLFKAGRLAPAAGPLGFVGGVSGRQITSDPATW